MIHPTILRYTHCRTLPLFLFSEVDVRPTYLCSHVLSPVGADTNFWEVALYYSQNAPQMDHPVAMAIWSARDVVVELISEPGPHVNAQIIKGQITQVMRAQHVSLNSAQEKTIRYIHNRLYQETTKEEVAPNHGGGTVAPKPSGWMAEVRMRRASSGLTIRGCHRDTRKIAAIHLSTDIACPNATA